MSALGFSVGLGLASLTASTLRSGLLDADTYRLVMAIVYGLAGLFAGALFGLSLRSSRTAVLSAILGALGLGGGFFASQFVFDQFDPDVVTPFLGQEIGSLALPFVQYVLIGLLVGAMLGLAEARADQVLRCALAGALALGMAYLVQVVAFTPLLTLLFQPLADFVFRHTLGTLLPTIISWALAGALGGALAGYILGEALA